MRRLPSYGTTLALLACGASCHAQAAPDAPAHPPVVVVTPAPPSLTTQAAAVDPAKEKLIRQLLEVTGVVKLSQQMMDQMFTSMQSAVPDLPTEFWSKTRARFKADDLVAMIIPVYDKYYSKEELQGLLTFYESPLGRKVIATLPQVQRESMTIGQAWGRKQAEDVLAEIAQERKSARKHAQTKAGPQPFQVQGRGYSTAASSSVSVPAPASNRARPPRGSA